MRNDTRLPAPYLYMPYMKSMSTIHHHYYFSVVFLLSNRHDGSLGLGLYFLGGPGNGVLGDRLCGNARRLRLAESAVEFLGGSRAVRKGMC